MTSFGSKFRRRVQLGAFVLVALFLRPGLSSAEISVSIYSPTAGGAFGSPLQVIVTVSSTFEVRGVRADVAGRSIDLTYTTQAYYIPRLGYAPGWVGSIPLTGLTRGAQTLSITATDVFDATATTSRSFIYDELPSLTVQHPLNGSVARPGLRVAMSCTDDDPSVPCELRVRHGFDQVLASGQGSIDTTVSLAGFDAQQIGLTFIASDSTGREVTQVRYVLVDSTPYLREIESVSGPIIDVSESRILFYESFSRDLGPYVLKIRDRVSGLDSTIFTDNNGSFPYDSAVLTPYGAMFALSSTDNLYEWRDGMLSVVDTDVSASSLAINGHFAIWVRGRPLPSRELRRRNLETGVTVVVSVDAGNWRNGVAANGDVAFWSSGVSTAAYDVYRFRDGSTQLIAGDPVVWETYPLTDGARIVFRRDFSGIALFTESGDTITLSPKRSQEANPGRDYLLEGGWTAFNRPSNTGQLQVWLRSPAGALQQQSFFGSDSTIDALAAIGQATFVNGNRIHLPRPAAAPLVIGSGLGKSFWLGGKWLVRIGRTIFEVDETAACSFAVSPAQASFSASAGFGEFDLTTGFGCAWTTQSSATWLTVTAGTAGDQSRTISYMVAANPNSQQRSATVTVGGQTHTVTQAGIACTYALSSLTYSAPGSGASTSVQVTTSAPDCPWSIGDEPPFVDVTAGASGFGNGTVFYTVGRNPTSFPREATLRIAGHDHRITQAGVLDFERLVVGTGNYPTRGGWFAVQEGYGPTFAHSQWVRFPWPDYNARSGAMNPATGDVDGDGLDEIVIGPGEGGGGWIAVLDDAAHGYALLKWIQVQWPAYNAVNGAVYPAVGDLDGDGDAEIVAGLGRGGAGWLQVFGDAASNFAPSGWHQVQWPAYAAADGSTHPAIGDLDRDGVGDVLVGLGPGSGGWMEVLSGPALESHSWARVQWNGYNASNGETFPAIGTSATETITAVGLGRGGAGYVEQLEMNSALVLGHRAWLQLDWSAYNDTVGATRPAVGNLDDDSELEIAVGLDTFDGNGGWFRLFDDRTRASSSLGWHNLGWDDYKRDGGPTFPVIGRLR